MSTGICRAQKVSGASGGVGAYIHNERIKDHSNSNPDIDFSRSAENYHIGEYENALTYNQRIEKRLAEGYKGKKAVRKDAVKLVEVLFTSDKAFFESQPDNGRSYFEDCLKWASERFGEDNIIADVVHLDEATPHMHLDFVPLTEDGRLSAKEVLGDKKKLQELQDDFYEKVSKKYGLERGQRANLDAGESGRKNLTVQELKKKTLQEEIEQQEQKKSVNEKFLHRQKMQIDMYRKQLDRYDEQISGLEDKIDSLAKERDNLAEENEKVLKWQQDANAELLKLKDEKTRLEKNVIEKRAELEDTTASEERARAALRDVSGEVRNELRQIYKEVVKGILNAKDAVKRHDLPGAERVLSETESSMRKQAENVEKHSHVPAQVIAREVQKPIDDAKELVKKEYSGGAGSAGVQNAQKDSVREKLEKFSQESQKGHTEPSQASERQDIKRRHRGR